MKPRANALFLTFLLGASIVVARRDRTSTSSSNTFSPSFAKSAQSLLEEAFNFDYGGEAGSFRQNESEVRQRDSLDEDLRQVEADLRHALQLTDEEERRVALAATCTRWARIDPADALALARELRFEDRSGAVQADIIQHWAEINLAAAHEWITREAPEEHRENLLSRLAYVWSQTHPRAAARLVADQIAPGSAQEEAGISVLHQWALRDFAGAFAWAERFPVGSSRERAFAELYHIANRRLPAGLSP